MLRAVWCPACRCHIYPPCQVCRLRASRRRPTGALRPQRAQPKTPATPGCASRCRNWLRCGINLLEGRRILTVGDLLQWSPDELLRLPNFAGKTLRQVYRAWLPFPPLGGVPVRRRYFAPSRFRGGERSSQTGAVDHFSNRLSRPRHAADASCAGGFSSSPKSPASQFIDGAARFPTTSGRPTNPATAPEAGCATVRDGRRRRSRYFQRLEEPCLAGRRRSVRRLGQSAMERFCDNFPSAGLSACLLGQAFGHAAGVRCDEQ